MNSAVESISRLRLFKALTHRPIAVLWAGQAFSNIGDEIYKVALIWLAVKMIGSNAGYLAAGQAASVLLFGLLGGIWADHWDPRQTMFKTDLLRGVIVLIPLVWILFFSLNLGILIFVALSTAALSAFFEPALQAVIPRLARNRELMQATNGLMGTTSRLARAVGPGLVGALTGIFAPIHFFALDSLSFAISAFAIHRLKKELPAAPAQKHRRAGIIEGLTSGFHEIRGNSLVKYVLYGKAIASGCWSVVLPLGIALLVQKTFPGNIKAYGLILASYGVGNLSGALVLSNFAMDRPIKVLGSGFILMGLCFVVMAEAPSLLVMVIFAAIGAIGGPMNDLAHIDIIQRTYPPDKLVRVVRLRMAIEYGGILCALLIASSLFRLLTPNRVIQIAGFGIAAVGLVGLLFYKNTATPTYDQKIA